MTERTGSRPERRRKRGHAAASSRVLAGGLAVSATLGLSGMMAAAANTAQVAASAVRPAQARITFAAPKHYATAAPPRTAATSPTVPSGPAPAPTRPPITFATKAPAPVAPVANTIPAPVVVAPPATPPRVVTVPPAAPVTTSHAS